MFLPYSSIYLHHMIYILYTEHTSYIFFTPCHSKLGVNHLIDFESIPTLLSHNMPSTDIYIQPCILAVAPENVFFRLVECRCLCFLRSFVWVPYAWAFLTAPFLRTPLIHSRQLAFAAKTNLSFSGASLETRLRQKKRTWSSGIQTHDLWVSSHLLTHKTMVPWLKFKVRHYGEGYNNVHNEIAKFVN